MLADDTTALPKRLRELRLEMGWSLDDAATVLKAGGKGVISNWEATTDRRRIPPLGVLIALSRWYGVSLDYLMGIPGADRDSPGVRLGKIALRERFPREVKRLTPATPGARLRLCVQILQETAPGAFFTGRIAAQLLLSEERLQAVLDSGDVVESTLDRFARVMEIPVSWFYVKPQDI